MVIEQKQVFRFNSSNIFGVYPFKFWFDRWLFYFFSFRIRLFFNNTFFSTFSRSCSKAPKFWIEKFKNLIFVPYNYKLNTNDYDDKISFLTPASDQNYNFINTGKRIVKLRLPPFINVYRLYLKGVGYKFIRFKKNRAILRIELGYSVSIYLRIPNSIFITTKRDRIALFSFYSLQSLQILNKLINILYCLRPADVYKGKGVRYINRTYVDFKPGKRR